MRLHIFFIGLIVTSQASAQNYTISEIKKYLAANADRLDAIEGVWRRTTLLKYPKETNIQKRFESDTIKFPKQYVYMVVFKKNNCYAAADFNNYNEVISQGCSLKETQNPNKYVRTALYYNNTNIQLLIEKGEITSTFYYKPLAFTGNPENDSSTFIYYIENYKRIYPTEKEIHLAQRNNPEYLLEEGIRSFKIKDYPGAIKLLTGAINLNPDLTGAYYFRSGSFYAVKDFSHALSDINSAIKQKNNSADFYSLRGSINIDLKNFNQAISDFSESIKLKPTNALVYYNRSIAKFNVNDLKGAVLDCNKAIEIVPTDIFFNQQAWYLFKTGDLKNALTDASLAIKLNSKNANFFDTRGCIYFEGGQYNEALRDFNQAIKLNPTLGNSYLYRGRIKFLTAQKTEACKDWSIAAALGESKANEYNRKYCK